MSNAIAKTTSNTPAKTPARTPARAFRDSVTSMAESLLTDWVGPARAAEATGRVASALSAAAASAKDPSHFYNSTPQSVGAVIAIAALTGIMPSAGANALAYAVPRSPRRGEPPMLQYSLSHRGLNALARRCGLMMIATPVSVSDTIRVTEGGEVEIAERDLDDPPTTLDELRGVVVAVKDIETGVVLTSGWMPKKLILERKNMSQSASSQYGPWSNWPVEMAIKTAMHYAISRGWCVIDDTEAVRALAMDVEAEMRTVEADAVRVTAKSVEQAFASEEPAAEPEPESEPESEPIDSPVSNYERRLLSVATHGELMEIAAEIDGDDGLTPAENKKLGGLINELGKGFGGDE